MQYVDLDTCDREPIHFIGAIQPHGALLAVGVKNLCVDFASLNTRSYVGFEPQQLLGRPLHEFLGPENLAELLALPLEPSRPELLKPWFIDLRGPEGESIAVECLPHRNDGHIILEFLARNEKPTSVWEDEILRGGHPVGADPAGRPRRAGAGERLKSSRISRASIA